MQELWKAQEEPRMEMQVDEVRARARRLERENVAVYWAAIGLLPVFFVGFLHNVMSVSAPWLLAGSGLAAATFCFMVARMVWSGPNRMRPAEPCLEFLRREFAGKVRGLLWIRNCLLLLIPAMAAAWWGGGPVKAAKAWGIRSALLMGFFSGPGVWITLAAMVGFLWFSFSWQARKAAQELERLNRYN